MKLIKSIKDGYYWTRAIQASAREDYVKAYDLLEKCTFCDYEFWILRTFLLFVLARDEDAEEAKKQASKLLKDSKISLDDKAYLNAYLERLQSRARGLNLDISDVQLNKVSKHHLSNFPLRSHPDWKNI
jgi:DNA-binding PucR family transcriptional regulator